jgi:hypothetical protein
MRPEAARAQRQREGGAGATALEAARRATKGRRPGHHSHLERGLSLTLAQAAEQVTSRGGKYELSKDGRLLVSLPRSALGGLTSGLPGARILYLAEPVVVEHLRAKRPLPERARAPDR